jgi:MOSC domain-containing protein YiiM
MNKLAKSPADGGVLEHIVLRLPGEKRATPKAAIVSPEGGLDGDRWGLAKSPNKRAQISVMNSRFLRLIAGSEDRISLAGDNLIIDLDLSDKNLPPGTRLQIGGALFETTDLAHTGCEKFKSRYGADALELVNSDAYKSQRLRGLFLRVIEGGKIAVGDPIRKMK